MFQNENRVSLYVITKSWFISIRFDELDFQIWNIWNNKIEKKIKTITNINIPSITSLAITSLPCMRADRHSRTGTKIPLCFLFNQGNKPLIMLASNRTVWSHVVYK